METERFAEQRVKGVCPMYIPDRQKLRREYLKKKAEAVGKNVGGHLLIVGGFIFTTFCGCATVILLLGALIGVFFGELSANYVFGAIILAMLTIAGWRTVDAVD